MALILLESALRFRRKDKKKAMLAFGFVSVALVALNVYYFMKDGRENLRPEMMKVEQELKK